MQFASITEHVTIMSTSFNNNLNFSILFFHAGKQQHIQSVIQQIEKDHKVKIKREEVILLDDDETNILEARNSKMKTLLVKGDDSLDELLEARYR